MRARSAARIHRPVRTASVSPMLQRRCACAGARHALSCTDCSHGAVVTALRQAGSPLDSQVRGRLEQRLGHDFGRVRVHTDAPAALAAQSVAADAFTVGRHVVFAAGQYAPRTAEGERLLAHELVHTIQQGQAEAPDPSTLRVSDPGDASERAAEQAGAGIAPAAMGQSGSRGALIQRQPEQPPNLGPPVSEVPRPPICSLIFEGGGVYWKCENIPKLGSTPKIPLDPRKIPDEIDKILKQSKPGGNAPGTPPGPLPGGQPQGPGPFPVEDPTLLVEQMCKLYPFICHPARTSQPDPAQPGPVPPGAQLGVLWTDTILFEQNHPAPGESNPGTALTAAGRATLQSVREWLDLSPDLQIRLIGGASSEGTSDYNQALATRRVRFILSALAGHAGRIADPVVGDGAQAGCQSLGKGLWSCGEARATQDEGRAEDRFVTVTFMRNNLPALQPLQQPGFKPHSF
jgi:hypothetical protein